MRLRKMVLVIRLSLRMGWHLIPCKGSRNWMWLAQSRYERRASGCMHSVGVWDKQLWKQLQGINIGAKFYQWRRIAACSYSCLSLSCDIYNVPFQ